MPKPKISTEERFWRHVSKTDNGCWIWTAHRSKSGYGMFWMPGTNGSKDTNLRAHRVSWILTHGEIPNNLWVLHRCDNPPCVNPLHLFLGTGKDNTQDMISKGRYKNNSHHLRGKMTGEKNRRATITNSQVPVIRELLAQGMKQSKIARKLGISKFVVWSIKAGACWNHVK